MKETPILFSTPMVQPIRVGIKTQTRRIIDPQPSKQWAVDKWVKEGPGAVDASDLTAADMEMGELISNCRYGQPGDVLWVKETFYAYGWWIREANKWRFIDFTLEEMAGSYHYMDNPPAVIIPKRKEMELGWYKRPSLFMPRHASRITLEIKGIQAERLQDISEEDAKAEGLTCFSKDAKFMDCQRRKPTYKWGIPDSDGLPGNDDHGWPWEDWEVDPRNAYRKLWEKINGQGSWEANPWVRVVSFVVISIKGAK